MFLRYELDSFYSRGAQERAFVYTIMKILKLHKAQNFLTIRTLKRHILHMYTVNLIKEMNGKIKNPKVGDHQKLSAY